MNGLQGLTLLKSHSFVIVAVYGLKVLIPYIFHTFFFSTLDFHRVHTKLVMAVCSYAIGFCYCVLHAVTGSVHCL